MLVVVLVVLVLVVVLVVVVLVVVLVVVVWGRCLPVPTPALVLVWGLGGWSGW